MAIDYEAGIAALRELLRAHVDTPNAVRMVSAPNHNAWEIRFEWFENEEPKAHRVRFDMSTLEEHGGTDWNDAVLRLLKDIPRIAHLIDYKPRSLDHTPGPIQPPRRRRIQIRRTKENLT